MLAFAHAGLTVGSAAVAAVAFKRGQSGQASASWVTRLGRMVDVRILVIGSLLPDIIDKPVGQYLLVDVFGDGRIFSHSLIFLAVISLAGLLVYRRYRKNWLLALAFGTFTHLVMDEMWRAPRVLFWPLLGFQFERADLSHWFTNMWLGLLHAPKVYVPEIIGAGVLLWFGITLIRRRKVFAFIWRGQVE